MEKALNEHKEYIEPKKEKRSITLPNKSKEITPSVNKINFYEGFEPYYVKPVDYKIRSVHKYRWTTIMDKFLSGKFKSDCLKRWKMKIKKKKWKKI